MVRYLVETYPHLAFEPYTLDGPFENPYANITTTTKYIEEINEKFKSNYKALKSLIGKKDFENKIKTYGLYTGNKSYILYNIYILSSMYSYVNIIYYNNNRFKYFTFSNHGS